MYDNKFEFLNTSKTLLVQKMPFSLLLIHIMSFCFFFFELRNNARYLRFHILINTVIKLRNYSVPYVHNHVLCI